MKKADVDVFEKQIAQLESLHSELTILAKKSPNDAVNAFKLKFVNSVLAQLNQFFGAKYRPFPDFEIFVPEEMPSNSDVTFMMGQYLECAEKFRSDNVHHNGIYWVWSVDGTDIRTAAPKKIFSK
jgi:hypothetical protein